MGAYQRAMYVYFYTSQNAHWLASLGGDRYLGLDRLGSSGTHRAHLTHVLTSGGDRLTVDGNMRAADGWVCVWVGSGLSG